MFFSVRWVGVKCGLVVVGMACFCMTNGFAHSLYQWVQLVGDNRYEVRAILPATEACPAVLSNHIPLAMTVRAQPDSAFFVRVCSYAFQNEGQQIVLEGQRMPVPPHVLRIVAFGDSGCRVTKHIAQDCAPHSWPFATVVRAAAAVQPDLVIHVGDYYYREQCIPGSGCTAEPTGDNWSTWRADFFAPAAALFAQAPFVFVRGNHEDCRRGWRGWMRFLSVGPMTKTCQEMHADTWYGHADTFYGVIVDASAGEDRANVVYQDVRKAVEDLHLNTLYHRPWLILHRPLWSYFIDRRTHKLASASQSYRLTLASWAAHNCSLVLSGHIHLAELLELEGLPLQFIAGTGGATLDLAPVLLPQLPMIGKDVVKVLYADGHPGFTLFVHNDLPGENKHWDVTWHVLHQADQDLFVDKEFLIDVRTVHANGPLPEIPHRQGS